MHVSLVGSFGRLSIHTEYLMDSGGGADRERAEKRYQFDDKNIKRNLSLRGK